MYCSSCGETVIKGLSYCKHCGARLSDAKEPDENKLSEASFNFLLAGILGIPIAGLGIVIGLMSVMKKELGFGDTLTITFTSLSFLLMLAAESVFIWFLINRAKAAKETRDQGSSREVVIKGLGEAPVRRLPEPVASITEDTTRSFEPISRETKPQ